MSLFTTTTVRDSYHNALLAWQRENFPELKLLQENWSKYFKGQRPFELVAKIGTQTPEVIEIGKFIGQKRFERADEMNDDMFYKARAIIKAQCSTELGSIQQHRMSLERHTSDEAQYAILRIMAEELRHAYQMLWVLEHDATWNRQGEDIAKDTIEELLSMQHGGHVLDAFNLDFDDFLDNCVFAAIIDMVGKYQLDMQRAFSYAPVARSMGPMYLEEGFHLGSGKRFTKEIAVEAALGKGDYSLRDVQHAFNKWLPRGLEMFGNEHGGQSNLAYSFKTKSNYQAQSEYYNEVGELVEYINGHLVQTFRPDLSMKDAKLLASEILAERHDRQGIRYDDLIKLPHRHFFRWRGLPDFVFQPYDLLGELLTQDGRPLSPQEYLNYLKGQLSDSFLRSSEFKGFEQELFDHHAKAAADARKDKV